MGEPNKKVLCADGFNLSIQAKYGLHCTPRIDDAEEYTEVEIAYLSEEEELLAEYRNDDYEYIPLYSYVPVLLVSVILAKHGGIVSGEVPNGFLKNFLPKDKK